MAKLIKAYIRDMGSQNKGGNQQHTLDQQRVPPGPQSNYSGTTKRSGDRGTSAQSPSKFNRIVRLTTSGVRGAGSAEQADPPTSRAQPAATGSPPRSGEAAGGARGSAGEEEGTWRGYLGSGAGEENSLSRRCSPGDASRPSLPPAARSARRPPPRGVRARLALLGHTAARAGRAVSSSRAAPRRGTSRAERPAFRTHSRPVGGRENKRRLRKASRGKRPGTNASSATRAAPLPQRRRRPGPCCCCQLVERTLSMRAPRPHPGHFSSRVGFRS
ncbi:uncharacterized protein LOC111816422 [Octodon degus]|uniref:Uncharacterized protein LOC111816422 n=1 Tax=Octodon degus TaxID=10160 RepID=A0A6P6EAV8_OCTDE|nr:uncharacterized protein LOC111816422 [Octodon degus]